MTIPVGCTWGMREECANELIYSDYKRGRGHIQSTYQNLSALTSFSTEWLRPVIISKTAKTMRKIFDTI